ncbi:hypothetical protein Agub_g13845, partial [Astrephomene gubernaculifera]
GRGKGTLPDSEGYVCGVARVSLLDLARGYTRFSFHANIAPHTTVRGAASLDWTKRPGNYAEAGSLLKGEVRCAAPLSATRGCDPSLRVFARALFIMDYRDSDLFHTLEDVVRKNNAWKLGFKQPADKLPPDQLPPELKAKRRALEAAAAAAAVTGSGGSSGAPSHDPSYDDDKPRGHRSSLSSAGSAQQAPRRSSSAYSLQDMAVKGGGGGGGGTGGAVRGWSAASPSPQPPRRDSASPAGLASRLDNNDSKRHVLFDSDSEADDEPDEPPTAAELALDALCVDIDRVQLEMRELQALSTTQLSGQQAGDRQLDLLTGWHLVDGRERIILVEGLAEGAMRIVKGIAEWALETPKPEEGWRRRAVLFSASPALRTASRLYAPLGVDLWIVKLRAPLPKLLGEPGSFATGRVRPDCVQGLRRLGALRSVACWSRQMYDLSLWPSPQQLQLVDKKFGGELMAADVLGVEVEDEPDSDDEDGGPALGALLEDSRSQKSSNRSNRSRRSSRSRRSMKSLRSCRSGKSGKSGKGSKGSKGSRGGKGGKGSKGNKGGRRGPRGSSAGNGGGEEEGSVTRRTLDARNEDYLRMRRKMRAARLQRDWVTLNRDSLRALEAKMGHIKESWREWNPQRAAHEELVAAMRAGTLTAEEIASMSARRPNLQPIPGTLGRQDAVCRGWYPHPTPFKWPAPRAPAEFRDLPNKPSGFRVEQLSEPWEDPSSAFKPTASAAGAYGGGGGGELSDPAWEEGRGRGEFRTVVRGEENGLFGADRSYWLTIHGEREAELRAAQVAAAEEWRRRLVVADPVMRTTLPQRPPRPAQADRFTPLLHDDPTKRGLKVSHAPAPPLNSDLDYPWVDPRTRVGVAGPAGERGGGGPREDKSKLMSPSKDFRHVTGKPKTAVHKLPYNQSWTASLRDKYYGQ